MDGSSKRRSLRWQQFCAGALCGASLIAGQLVFGEDTAPVDYRRPTPITSSPLRLPEKAEGDASLPPILDGKSKPRPTAPSGSARPTPVANPGVGSAIPGNASLPPIVSANAAKPKAPPPMPVVAPPTGASPGQLPPVVDMRSRPAPAESTAASTSAPHATAAKAPEMPTRLPDAEPASVSPWMTDIREALARAKPTTNPTVPGAKEDAEPAKSEPAASSTAKPVDSMNRRSEFPLVQLGVPTPPASETKSSATPSTSEAPKTSSVYGQFNLPPVSVSPPSVASAAPSTRPAETILNPSVKQPGVETPPSAPYAVPFDNSFVSGNRNGASGQQKPQATSGLASALPPSGELPGEMPPIVTPRRQEPAPVAAESKNPIATLGQTTPAQAAEVVSPAIADRNFNRERPKLVGYETGDRAFASQDSPYGEPTPAGDENDNFAPITTLPSARTTVAPSQPARGGMQFTQAEAPRPLPGVPAGPFEMIGESGSVSVMVRRSMLLRTKNAIYRTAVVDPGICDVIQFTPREISIIGKSQGSTHVTFWFDEEGSQPITYLVKVEPDSAEVKKEEDKYKLLEDVVNEMFPDSKIHLVLVADKLIVKGQAKDSEEATQIMSIIRTNAGRGAWQSGTWGPGGWAGVGAGLSEGVAADVLSDSATGNANRARYQVINMLRVPGVQQVALRVKIAELNRTAARGFGVDVQGNVQFSDSPEGTDLFFNSILNLAGGGAPALLAQFDGDDISIGIRYLQQQGVIRLLSEPTVVTMSGRPATFVAGGEFAVPTVVGSAGINAVTTDFRAFGAIISFLPTVVDKDRIRLEVAPEFSQINQQIAVNGTPGLKTRSVTTTVEMREGQTLAIAGLLEDNMNGSTVGDLPFLARVFGRRSMSRAETELIILVTPELMHAMEPEEVPPLPGFDVTEPDNCQFFLHGRIEGNPTREYRSTVWPRLKNRYKADGPAMTSGPFGHGQ